MAIPIQNLIISHAGGNRLNVTFDYPVRPQGFTHALVAILEQDGARDAWAVRSQTAFVAGEPPNVLTTQRYSWFCETTGRWMVSPASTSGDADDYGQRHYVVDLERHRSGSRVTLEFPFGSQPDAAPAGLEFYALVAVVAVVGDKVPVAMLGELAVSATLTGV